MFSPYYAWSRRRRRGDPADHCAINVALYGERRCRWAMTERGRDAVSREANVFAVGPSALSWDGAALTISIDEWTFPKPSRVRGVVRVFPTALVAGAFALDAGQRHVWRPIAPSARFEVSLTHPALSWKGDGYLDTNWGSEPLEAAFRQWDWSRAATRDGSAILYDVTWRDGAGASVELRIDRDGSAGALEPAGRVALNPSAIWRMPRGIRSDPGSPATVVRTLEDTPFYARSLVAAKLRGQDVTAFHESLSLDRFRLPVVQAMLPFRMPRKTW